jgi:hypothetical protein
LISPLPGAQPIKSSLSVGFPVAGLKKTKISPRSNEVLLYLIYIAVKLT